MQLVNQDFDDNRENELFQEYRHLRVDCHHRILFQVQVDCRPYFGGGEGKQTREQKALFIWARVQGIRECCCLQKWSWEFHWLQWVSCLIQHHLVVSHPALGTELRLHTKSGGKLELSLGGIEVSTSVYNKQFSPWLERYANSRWEEKQSHTIIWSFPRAGRFPITIMLDFTNLTLWDNKASNSQSISDPHLQGTAHTPKPGDIQMPSMKAHN